MSEAVKSADRLEILNRIAALEAQGIFDEDVEDDPPFTPLKEGEVDFLKKKLISKIKRRLSIFLGKTFYKTMMRNKQVLYKGVKGLENLEGFEGGAVVTCNHCHIFDNYAVLLGLKEHFGRLRLYKIVREGNFSLPGMIGFIMQNCDTLPLSQNKAVMRDMMGAVSTLLKKEKLVLIYPEQGMWWNYRKPRPLKSGAFKFAAKSGVPVIPCFLTLSDSDIIGGDGFPVQEFTLNVLPLIYPDQNLSVRENCEIMKKRNFELWKDLYEKSYGTKLSYLCDQPEADS